MNLRRYQSEALAALDAGWVDYERQLIVIPTGGGKTIVFSFAALAESSAGGCTLILAHRDELLEQAQDKLQSATGLTSVLEKAEYKAYELFANDLFYGQRPSVVVGSVQTFTENRLKRWDPNTFTQIIIDEAHHALSNAYRRILDYFTGAKKVFGVTATPDRGDKKNLGAVFQNIAFEYTLTQAIRDGFLCPIRAKLIPLQIDLSTVRMSGGDFDVNDLDMGLGPYLKRIAEEIAGNIDQRKTLAFLPLIKTSQAFVEILQGLGIRAEHIDGNSPDRKEKLTRFERGDFQLLSNSALLLEGYDCPPISCIADLSPTTSRARYQQKVGRGTRLSPDTGKTDLLLLDFLWQTEQHDLCVPASLVAKSQEERQMMMDIIAEGGVLIGDDDGVDLLEAQEEFQHARERNLAKKLREQQTKKKKTINPIAFALSLHDDDLADYVPMMSWEALPPTDKQMATLEKFGFDVESVQCKGHASMLLDRIIKRSKMGLCSPKQANLLGKYGYETTEMTFKDASSLITRIKENGWRAVSYEPSPAPEPVAVGAGADDDIEGEDIPF